MNKQPSLDMTRDAPDADLTTRRASAAGAPAAVGAAAPMGAANALDDAEALRIGRMVISHSRASDAEIEWDYKHSASVAATAAALAELDAHHEELIEPLRRRLSAAEAAYDEAYAVWERSPARLAMVRADTAREEARGRLSRQTIANDNARVPMRNRLEDLQREQNPYRIDTGAFVMRRYPRQ